MGKPTGFLEIGRQKPSRREAAERVRDWHEFERPLAEAQLRAQSARCMDCGVPFCHHGCPLGNNIPEWNDLVYRGRWREASDSLHATNNFPEFTGRTCPAPCEESCVLNISHEPVTIKHIEQQIVDRAFESGWITPRVASAHGGTRVAVIGSGPAGLAAAQQLARLGHAVTVFERSDRLGGLLRYGIPDFKLEKGAIDRRIAQMEGEGVTFRTGIDVGTSAMSAEQLRSDYHAICMAGGARRPRDLAIPGRALRGIYLAMDYLEQANRVVAGDLDVAAISATGKRVAILGGGDTGADCLGTAHRQGALSVHQFELLPMPPAERTEDMPWPSWPMIQRTSAAHEEGGVRDYSIATKAFAGDDRSVKALQAVRLEWTVSDDGRKHLTELPGSGFNLPVDLVLLAMGFVGAEVAPWVGELGLQHDARGNLSSDGTIPGVFSCGDARRGASLVVWAIREGRDAAARIDAWLRAPR